MALPPSSDINETFLREVDEEYRRDKVRDFFVENRVLLISAVVLFLLATGGWFFWQSYQQKRSGEQVEELAKVYRDLGQGNFDAAQPALKPLEESHSEGVSASAIFTSAAIDLERNNPKSAIAKYKTVADDSGMAQPYRDIALIRQTSLEFDQLKPEEVIARMKPLAAPGEPWFGSAGELTALALVKQGKKDEAGKLFASIGRDKTVPESIRARVVQMAASLGIDTSDMMNESAQ